MSPQEAIKAIEQMRLAFNAIGRDHEILKQAIEVLAALVPKP